MVQGGAPDSAARGERRDNTTQGGAAVPLLAEATSTSTGPGIRNRRRATLYPRCQSATARHSTRVLCGDLHRVRDVPLIHTAGWSLSAIVATPTASRGSVRVGSVPTPSSPRRHGGSGNRWPTPGSRHGHRPPAAAGAFSRRDVHNADTYLSLRSIVAFGVGGLSPITARSRP